MEVSSERLLPQTISSSDDAFAQLRADVDYLGRVLGSVLIQLEGKAFFERVEQVRNLTKSLRASPDDSSLRDDLTRLLASLSIDEAERLLRAFTVYFQLVNTAESIQRVRVNRWRESQATPENPRKESVADAVKTLKDEGWSRDEVRHFLEGLDIQLTLTAHPTEVKRYTIRLKLERIGNALRQLSERDLAPGARRNLERLISAEVTTLWQTREILSEKPTVLDEVKSALYYFRSSLLESVPRLMLGMEDALASYFGEDDGSTLTRPLPPVVKFRSWIGGDRDGNPFVSPDVTQEAYQLQQNVATEQHIKDVDLLVQRLSQWQERINLSGAFIHDLAELDAKAGKPTRFDEQPYRQKLFHMHRVLREVAEGHPEDIGVEVDSSHANQYLDGLSSIETSLERNQEGHVAKAFVRPAFYRASAFGLHLAALDIREHSSKHEQAVTDLLHYAGVCEDYSVLDEDARITLLAQEISSKRPIAPAHVQLDDNTMRALSFLEVFGEMQTRFGKHATGSYIVSMTDGASDVLEVLLLAKQAGLREVDPVPLFETVDDLNRAASVLTRLFEIPAYLEHVRYRGIQEVMIGYSDSNKDAGFVAANWALYQAQEQIAAVCQDYDVKLRLFHGRGTSIGRGGGPR
ncbi:MAG: phosphoenolpyruvate carboxylase, partial [Deinococcota bacterium]